MSRGLIRIRLRTMLLLVPLVGLGLFVARVYLQGYDEFVWIVKLRYGGVQARREALAEAWVSHPSWSLWGTALDDYGPRPASLRRLEWGQSGRWSRFAARIRPEVRDATDDADPLCRALALRALASLATSSGTSADERTAFRRINRAVEDPDPEVRAMAVSLLGLGRDLDPSTTYATVRSSMSDPSPRVHLACVRKLRSLGLHHPELRREIVPSLIAWLADHPDARVRKEAAEVLTWMGQDLNRDIADPPELLPALLGAMKDRDATVRREVVIGLAAFLPNPDRPVLLWASRSGQIRPAFEAIVADPAEDPIARQHAALGLFLMGDRDPKLIELIRSNDIDPGWPPVIGRLLEASHPSNNL